jgi:hypothetical protein
LILLSQTVDAWYLAWPTRFWVPCPTMLVSPFMIISSNSTLYTNHYIILNHNMESFRQHYEAEIARARASTEGATVRSGLSTGIVSLGVAAVVEVIYIVTV